MRTIGSSLFELTGRLYWEVTPDQQELIIAIENLFDPLPPTEVNSITRCGHCDSRIRSKRRAKTSIYCDKCGRPIEW